jgi:phospholipid N-methyltransferase
MQSPEPRAHPDNDRRAFFLEFLKHPLQIGSVIPSSRFLERRILEAAQASIATTILELGPGTGGVTRALLNDMPSEATLLSIEINPSLYDLLRQIDDKRLIPYLGSATDLQEILDQCNLPAPDVVVSGIPFSTMSQSLGSRLVNQISQQLASNGRFVAYQARKRVASLCEPYMGQSRSKLELLNIPPMRVYTWFKNGGAQAAEDPAMAA